MNALKHGLLSRECLIKDESEEELLSLIKGLRANLQPEGVLEMLLVDRITVNAWRLRRALKAESTAIVNELDAPIDTLESFTDPDITDKARVKKRYVKAMSGRELERLQRYENGIERGLFRALYELRRLQEEGEKMGSFCKKGENPSGEK